MKNSEPLFFQDESYRRGPDWLLETAAYTENALTVFMLRIDGQLSRLLARGRPPQAAASAAAQAGDAGQAGSFGDAAGSSNGGWSKSDVDAAEDPLPWFGSLLRLADAAVSLHAATHTRLQTLLPLWLSSPRVQQLASLQLLERALLDAASAAASFAGTAALLAALWLAPAAAGRGAGAAGSVRQVPLAGVPPETSRRWSERLLGVAVDWLLYVRRKLALLGRTGSGRASHSGASQPGVVEAAAAFAALLRLEGALYAGGEAASFPALLLQIGSLKTLLGTARADGGLTGSARETASNPAPPAKPWLHKDSAKRPDPPSRQKKRR
ncbi:hypothetical protein B5M42_008085 [Paenibacillus athensensis]|nr:hypothetical protein [Paenibacillus athensensis]MCD1258794.1 hypothetical protein [Paenibacillus athensensis]